MRSRAARATARPARPTRTSIGVAARAAWSTACISETVRTGRMAVDATASPDGRGTAGPWGRPRRDGRRGGARPPPGPLRPPPGRAFGHHRAPFGHHQGDGQLIGVGQGQVPADHASAAGQAVGRAREDQSGRAQADTDHLHVVEGVGPQPDPERLHDRLLGGEAGGQPGDRVGGAAGVGQLTGREQPLGHRGPTAEHPGEPRQVHGVDPHPRHADRRSVPVHQAESQAPGQCGHRSGTVPVAHSTVTTLARLRGRSTSRPCSRARW